MNFEKPDIAGNIFGIDIKHREDARSPLLTLVVEDDGYWHRKDFNFSAFWLNDLIKVAQEAKAFLEEHPKG